MKKMNRTANHAFGGGHTMRPSRHSSATESLTFVALMVLQFSVAPVGTWMVRGTNVGE